MPSSKSPHASRAARLLVEDAQGRRPFMRGIMVHSLLARGAGFDDAYRIASQVREALRGREVVRRDELAKLVEGHVGGREGIEAVPPLAALPPEIVVTGHATPRPFSKGVLSQSLLAAALEPNEAFEVARAMEADLIQRRVTSIDREDLRARVAQTLAATRGERAAARYRTWRDFQASERPMILLLAGTAGVGKTTLAQEVAHRLGITRVTSTDAIRQVMRIMLSPELVPAIHASSYEAWRVTPGLERSDDPVIDGFRAQVASVSVGVRAMMDRAVEENTSLILDGVSILPGMIDVRPYAESAHVVFLVIATLDASAFQHRFAARARDAHLRPPHRYLENLDAILRIQDHILELAEEGGLPIVDNIAFEASVQSILRHVNETLRTQGGYGSEAAV